MFNLLKNYRYNTLIVPNTNYFFERSEKINDKKAKEWIQNVSVACDQFLSWLFFERKDKNNLFYKRVSELEQATVQNFYKILVVFYLYLYLYHEDDKTPENFQENIIDVFEIKDSDFKNMLCYKLMDDSRNEIDYSSLPQELIEYFKNSKVSVTAMMHFYDLLLEEGFKKSFNKNDDLKLLVVAVGAAIAYFDGFVIKNV
ncbi:MAG: hypothetical protein KAI72_10000 [Candidatus Pacebacteria bacterium]|nr:hypothetical protein [Candidatus Paceibacterota bacterium]